jgi:serine/threonine protein kinase
MAEEQKYKILEKLDAGGMAEVFVAESESMKGFKKRVAIKRILPHLSKNQKFVQMFLDEGRGRTSGRSSSPIGARARWCPSSSPSTCCGRCARGSPTPTTPRT